MDTVNLKYLENRRAWSLLGGSLGRMIGRSISGDMVSLTFGVSQEWKRRDVLGKSIGWVLLFVGWPGLALVRAISRTMPFEPGIGMTLLAGILFLIAITSLVLLVIRYRRTPHVSSIRDRFVRLKGMGDPFVTTLPNWRGQSEVW